MPEECPALNSHDRNLLFTFSLDYTPMEGKNLYRYRLDNGTWSAWAGDQDAEYLNLDYGSHTFEVQGIDPFGRETAVTAVNFSVDYPFYLRWYMVIIYLLLIAFLIYTIMRLRLRHLEHDKLRLEQIVEERTEEVRKAHLQLVKQEKLATMVKLTQGLIDRILNPLNYINNFTKLSEGLVRDVEATINDEKEHISKDNLSEDAVGIIAELSKIMNVSRSCIDKSKVIPKEIEAEMAEYQKMKIEDLDLSVRAFNALKRAGINTLADIIQAFIENRLDKIRNAGITSKSYREIYERMGKICGEEFLEKAKDCWWISK
jgi:signal transduction histidine kinase